MKIEKILLLNSPIDRIGNRKNAVNDTTFPPLGLIKIATYLRRKFPELEIKVLDGDIKDIEYIKNFIVDFEPDIIGFSVLSPCYNSTLELIKFSKEHKIKYLVLGNDHASFFPELILKKRPEVSFIIVGDRGHIDFVQLVYSLKNNLDPFENVANLYGFINGKIVHSKIINNYKLEEDPLTPEPEFLGENNISTYINNYNKKFGHFHNNHIKQFIVNNARGCYKNTNRCLYCSIYDLTYQFGDPNFFWNMITYYHKNYGFNFFFEVCDNFGMLKKYRKILIETIPSYIYENNIEFMVYNDAFSIKNDSNLIEDFKKLNIKRVNLGLDSSDPFELSILKDFKNGDLNRFAVEKLSNNNIQIHCSFVLGALGETEESLKNTLNFIDEILNNDNVVAIELSPLYPLPNSPAWDLFIGEFKFFKNKKEVEDFLNSAKINYISEKIISEIRENFYNKDIIDLDLASKIWCDNLTHINYEIISKIIVEYNNKIEKAGKISGGFA